MNYACLRDKPSPGTIILDQVSEENGRMLIVIRGVSKDGRTDRCVAVELVDIDGADRAQRFWTQAYQILERDLGFVASNKHISLS